MYCRRSRTADCAEESVCMYVHDALEESISGESADQASDRRVRRLTVCLLVYDRTTRILYRIQSGLHEYFDH